MGATVAVTALIATMYSPPPDLTASAQAQRGGSTPQRVSL